MYMDQIRLRSCYGAKQHQDTTNVDRETISSDASIDLFACINLLSLAEFRKHLSTFSVWILW